MGNALDVLGDMNCAAKSLKVAGAACVKCGAPWLSPVWMEELVIYYPLGIERA